VPKNTRENLSYYSLLCVLSCCSRWSSRYRDWLRVGRSRDWIPMGVGGFSEPAQTYSGSNPSSCTITSRFFPLGQDVGAWHDYTHPRL